MQVKMLFACLVMLYFSTTSNGQKPWSGKIINGITKQPLEKASVRIPELQINTQTDAQGIFLLPHLPDGKFSIQYSYVGFQSLVKTIDTKDTFKLEISLFPTTISEQEIVISGFTPLAQARTAYSLEIFPQSEFSKRGVMNVNEALARIPGVSQLTTGAGIGKPVIRGLYGNRIQTVMQNIRFENQQWQDEHNSGLSETGIGRIEVIKGPASLLYGSEAIGGVIHMIEEEEAATGTFQGDFSNRFFSNTSGIQSTLGIKKTGEKISWKIRAGGQSHEDYADGKNERVLNTRFNSFQVKAGAGYHKNNFVNNSNYQFSHEGSGFILIDSLEHLEADQRHSRNLSLPHHLVNFHLLTSENTWYRNKSKIQINIGAHLNHRQEQEGGNKISIDMQYNSYNLEGKWERYLSEHAQLIAGGGGSFQTNNNSGKRIIIPDASIGQAHLFVFHKREQNIMTIQGGIRYDISQITTLETDILNSSINPNPFDEVVPFKKLFHAINGSAGINISFFKNILFKANVSSGFRTPNLAELSSNGLHEGTFRYEVGDIHLKTEQSFGFDGTIQYKSKSILTELTVFRNAFSNYIYLQPTAEEYIGFTVYRYMQTSARLYGGEFGFSLNPGFLSFLTLSSSAALTEGKKTKREYLPFIPPLKISNEIKIELKKLGPLNTPNFHVELINVAAQHKPATFETTTPCYNLINTGIGFELKVKSNLWSLELQVNNILNEAYFDHLSRIKPLGYRNMGRNISLSLNIPFNIIKPNKKVN